MSDDEILDHSSYYELLSLYINRNTPLAARLSCGGTIDAALAVAEGRCQRAVAIIRPPGHHAEPRDFMGFCFFNNVAVATKVVQARKPIRVLILDWWVILPVLPYYFDNIATGMFTTVRQSSTAGHCFFNASHRQGTAYSLHSKKTLLCFTFRSTGMKAGPSILAARLVALSRAGRARDWDCRYFRFGTRRD